MTFPIDSQIILPGSFAISKIQDVWLPDVWWLLTKYFRNNTKSPPGEGGPGNVARS
jgi:hypothetical protein